MSCCTACSYAAPATANRSRGRRLSRAKANVVRRQRNRAASSDKASLSRVRLNSGGYDTNGRYWGRGAPLYVIDIPNGPMGSILHNGGDMYTRAASRAAAKTIFRQRFPGVTFYR